MSNRPRFAVTWLTRSWSAAAVVVTVLALGSVSSSLGNSDRLVASSFASALKSNAASANPAAATRSDSGLVQLSGSEEFWLDVRTPAPGTVPVALNDPLQLGDLITFASGGRERRLEVVDIRPIGDVAMGTTGPAPIAQLMLVTCRDMAARDAHPVRFVIEKDDALSGGPRRAPRAL